MRLIDGRTIPDDAVSFDPATYHFTANGRDITNLIYRNDKLRLVPGFDVERENFRISTEKRNDGLGLEPLEESTGAILANQLITDPLGAPLESLNNGINKLLSSPGIIKVAILGGLGLVVYFAVKKA